MDKLSSNLILNNRAGRSGAGLVIRRSDPLLVNNVIADNRAYLNAHGAGVHVYDSNPRLLYTTLARNRGGDGSALCVYGDDSHVVLTNTILFSHTVGITVATGSSAGLEATLWNGNGANTGGLGAIDLGTINVHQPPVFAADGYHLTPVSPAIDAGIDAGVDHNLDGQGRLHVHDIGADEYWWTVYLTPAIYGIE